MDQKHAEIVKKFVLELNNFSKQQFKLNIAL